MKTHFKTRKDAEIFLANTALWGEMTEPERHAAVNLIWSSWRSYLEDGEMAVEWLLEDVGSWLARRRGEAA